MPYIKEEDRERLASGLPMLQPGELNYAITMLVDEYIKTHGESYRIFNDVIGALECSKLEVYRRLIAPYENGKIEENGDVFDDR